MRLLQEYTRACRHTGGIVLALGNDVVMLNDHARQALSPADQAELISRATEALAIGSAAGRSRRTVDLPSGAVARMFCRPAVAGRRRRARQAGGARGRGGSGDAGREPAGAAGPGRILGRLAAGLPGGRCELPAGRVAHPRGRARRRQARADPGRAPAPSARPRRFTSSTWQRPTPTTTSRTGWPRSGRSWRPGPGRWSSGTCTPCRAPSCARWRTCWSRRKRRVGVVG